MKTVRIAASRHDTSGKFIYNQGDFIVNEKDKVVNLTEEGVKKVEKFFHIENLADAENLEIQHNVIRRWSLSMEFNTTPTVSPRNL